MTPAELRPLLFSIAYRMLASVAEAEDVVQEAYLRYERALADGARRVAEGIPLGGRHAARDRRTSLSPPEAGDLHRPVAARAVSDRRRRGRPAAAAEQSDSLSMAFLLLLERLGPVERAVFLLHDVFGYEHREIAEIVGRSEENCRQIARRARQRMQAGRPRFEPSREPRTRLAERFFAAVNDGDVDGLVELLASDVVVYGDGGGKAPQWSRPIVGVERVARLLAGLGRQIREHGATLQLREVNGQPGAVVLATDGRLVNVFAIDIADGAVQTVRSVINPDKLRHLGPVADVWALLRGS